MADQTDKLAELLGASITVVDAVPESARASRDSKYAKLLLAVPDTGALKCEYESKKAAQIKAGIVRGHLDRNKQKAMFEVRTRGNAVYIIVKK